MDIKLRVLDSNNFFDVINLRSAADERGRIFEQWVGSNVFFLAFSQFQEWTNRAIYLENGTLIGFTTFGIDPDHPDRHELVSIMIHHEFQGRGYGKAALNVVINEMKKMYQCEKIFLTVIPENRAAIKLYEACGFEKTGETFQGNVEEDVYCLNIKNFTF